MSEDFEPVKIKKKLPNQLILTKVTEIEIFSFG